MSDDRKSPVSSPVLAQRRVALVAWWALVIAFGAFASPRAAAQVTLQVAATDGLPGFNHADLSRYLAQRMEDTRLADWHFEPAGGDGRARDRVEWTFKLNPYAGGEVRNFARTLVYERSFGVARPITIEARLYLNGEYHTLVEQQAIVRGGPDDPELAHAVASATEGLLGPSGAYRAIDTGQRPASRAR
jgi:hypothetical protein